MKRKSQQNPRAELQGTHAAIKGAIILVFMLFAAHARAAGPSTTAIAGFDSYIDKLEARFAKQHSSSASFLAPADVARLRNGEILVEELTPKTGTDVPGAMIHHWRGTAFVPGATAADLEHLLRDYGRYPQVYSPDVLAAKVLSQDGNHYETALRLSQKHIITVVLDTTYDIHFFPEIAVPDAHSGARGYDISHSTRVDEIASPGTKDEHALDADHEHGLLWRLNTYWTWREGDGGLYMQMETVSLTRAIPTGLGWAVGPFVESVPHDSLEFTLRSTANALRSTPH